MTSVSSPNSTAEAHEHLHLESPDAAYEAAVDALRAHGERVTDPRRAVIEVLARTDEHLSVDQVAALLGPSQSAVHRATIYRTLDVLAELGVVSHLHTSGAKTYHLATSPTGHEHLHAHCRLCGTVVVIPADGLSVTSHRISQATRFQLDAQQSTLVGVCAKCIQSI